MNALMRPEDWLRSPRQLTRNQRVFVLFITLIGSILCAYLIRTYGIRSMLVDGRSMEPTFEDGQRVWIIPEAYRKAAPQRSDLVAIEMADYAEPSVKRIVAMPGEYIQFSKGSVYVNRGQLEEPYLVEGSRTGPGRLGSSLYRIPPDCYFVLGDNRQNSHDSRHFGAVKQSQIIGRVF